MRGRLFTASLALMFFMLRFLRARFLQACFLRTRVLRARFLSHTFMFLKMNPQILLQADSVQKWKKISSAV